MKVNIRSIIYGLCYGSNNKFGSFYFSYNYSKSHVIRLQWVRNTVNKFTAKSNYYYESDEFSVISACFGEDSSRLGGNFNPNDILVLKVHSPKSIFKGNY